MLRAYDVRKIVLIKLFISINFYQVYALILLDVNCKLKLVSKCGLITSETRKSIINITVSIYEVFRYRISNKIGEHFRK